MIKEKLVLETFKFALPTIIRKFGRTKEEFEQWLVTAKEEFASIDAGFQPIRTAFLQE